MFSLVLGQERSIGFGRWRAMRWGIMTQTADVTTVALIQPLHGLTFALFHLGYASLRILSRAASPVWRRRFMGPSELAVQRTC